MIETIEKTELKGWRQVGNIHGDFYPVWLKLPLEDPSRYAIVSGASSSPNDGSVSRRYWAKTPTLYIGNRKTLKGAAALTERYILDLDSER